MKRFVLLIVAVCGLLFATNALTPAHSAAVDVFQPCRNGAGSASVCQDEQTQGSSTTNPVITVLKVVIQIIALIIGISSIIIIIVSGLRMITASGDSQSITNARNGILYALVGLVIALIAQGVVAYVLNKL